MVIASKPVVSSATPVMQRAPSFGRGAFAASGEEPINGIHGASVGNFQRAWGDSRWDAEQRDRTFSHQYETRQPYPSEVLPDPHTGRINFFSNVFAQVLEARDAEGEYGEDDLQGVPWHPSGHGLLYATDTYNTQTSVHRDLYELRGRGLSLRL